MSPKDHSLLADALRAAFEEAAGRLTPGATRAEVVDRLCKALASNNPRFRADLFRAACRPRQIVNTRKPPEVPQIESSMHVTGGMALPECAPLGVYDGSVEL